VLKASASVSIVGKRLWASADVQYMSSRLTSAGLDTGGFALANLIVLARRLPGRFDATIGLYNLFDTTYADPVSAAYVQTTIPQDGRNFRLLLSRRF
jgi:outer membrane receptor for ferrienterochelin and colicins